MTHKKSLKILFVSAEVKPLAKTGGLADVAGSLPKALAADGHDVRVAMPHYQVVPVTGDYVTDFPVDFDWRRETCVVRETGLDTCRDGRKYTVPVYLLGNYHYYDRKGIYCFHDDGERFLFLCKAALELIRALDWKPDIIHCNDWHTGPLPLMLHEIYQQDSFYQGIATVFTIHNLEYQGHFPKDLIRFIGAGDGIFTPEKSEFYGVFNFMKAGLVYADKINTVSNTYVKEILTPEFGERLDGLLQSRRKDLSGIVNGISYEEWNPETDEDIPFHFNAADLSGKLKNKLAIQKELGLPEKDVPVLSVVTRLANQKGLNLVLDHIRDWIRDTDCQLWLLGEGDPWYENHFRDLMDAYPDRVAVRIEFNASLAQKFYAGSDIFLMPSRFEPCGLGQIIAARYGTLPVVRKTGGLADTIRDVDTDIQNGNGFVFDAFETDLFDKAVRRALKMWDDRALWMKYVQRTMKQDFSWDRRSHEYEAVYAAALKHSVNEKN